MVHTTSTIATSQKANLRAIDSGFCLITRQVEPSIAIQACHILRRRTPEAEVNKYKDMWKLEEFNVDSTENLVSLRADWHASYDANCWAFVPSSKVLQRMENHGEKGTYQTPYRGYKKLTEIDYQFVAFPSLGLKFIARNDRDNTNNDIFSYEEDFSKFPMLKHHSHPYLVIANALPKFKEHQGDLTEAQLQLYAILLRIVKFWKKKPGPPSPKLPGRKRRMGDPEEGPSDDEDGGGPRKGKGKEKEKGSQAKPPKKPTAQAPTAGKGKGRQLQHDVAKTLCRPLQVSYPSPPGTTPPFFKDDNDVGSCLEKRRSIKTWIASVRPPERVRKEDVIAPDGEIGRAPYTGDWHKWCYPWTQPPEHSKYSSNDWAMQRCMCKLTAEPGGWDYTSDEGDSDTSDGEPCMSLSS